MSDGSSTPLEIFQGASESFAGSSHMKPYLTYVNRGLFRNPDRHIESYLEYLPQFGGKDFIQLVDEAVDSHRNDRPAAGPVRIADLGYGAGTFLLDCRTRWKNDVELTGVGVDTYTRVFTTSTRGRREIAPTDMRLHQNHIITVGSSPEDQRGNIINIRQTLGDNSRDFIVSSNVFQHISNSGHVYPHWELLKKIYRVLRPNGIAFVDALHLTKGSASDEETADKLREFEAYLTDRGYQFEFTVSPHGSVRAAFRKNLADITVPVRSKNGTVVIPGF